MMSPTDKIIKLLTDLGFTTDNRHLLKTSGSIKNNGYEIFYSATINGNFYSALIDYEKSIYSETYYIDSLNMSNGNLDKYINYMAFYSPSFTNEIFNSLQEIFKYELRKRKINSLLYQN